MRNLKMSNRTVLIAFVATLIGVHGSNARAGAPNCYVYGSGGYCEYYGRVSQAYINASEQIILYFDAPVDPAQAAAVGLSGVTVSNAAIHYMAGNKDVGKALFAAMLAAQARGAQVRIQMHSVQGGYLVFDRIWVQE
jgi:hypothetical protein